MKKIIALVFASALALAGCNSVNTTTVTPAVVTTVADVQAIVQSACGFLPAATTIASIISANPAVATGGQIASIICDAVTKKAAHKGAALPTVTVNGQVIEIKGRFVK
jgi:PBP1b-binding outer membrane lipoprotein LpoB